MARYRIELLTVFFRLKRGKNRPRLFFPPNYFPGWNVLQGRFARAIPAPTPAPAAALQTARRHQIGNVLQVLVRDNNVDQAMRVLKKKMQREGLFREMKARRAYEKPSERKTREKAEAVRRARKQARKQAQREGLLPAPKKKPLDAKPRPAAFGSAPPPR
jgi:small subunit ribosomal protein S21